jgi:hypothetical protein
MKMHVLSVCCALLCALSAAGQEVPARLDVTVQPEGAKVFVDGRLHGPAPCSVFGLEPGRHLLRVEAPSCVAQHAFVQIGPGEFVQRHFQLAEEKGIILVKTTPAGADVKCNGVSLGVTPLLVTSLASGRSYSLVLSLNGYQTKKIEVRTEGRRPLVREETLSLDSGVVDCSTEPAGATVIVNGVERGVTPVKLENVPKGLATIVFRLAGYEEETRELRMQAGASQTLSLRLKGRAAQLKVVSTPEGARVFLDDDFKGKTPLSLSSVKPGDHSLRVELDGYAPVTRSITMANAGAATEEFRLESTLGRIEVITTPPGAKISVDGRAVGTTAAQGDSNKSKLLAVERVAVGAHTVLVHCDGYEDRGYKINVASRETTQLYARLKRIFTPDTLLDTTRGIVRGVLVERDPLGNITLETAPGVQQRVMAADIRKISAIDR